MKYAAEYFRTAREREAIRRRRLSGATPPWSDDPVFNQWRFCNVNREDDKTTIWFRENVRGKLSSKVKLIRAVLAFRWFNLIPVGERIADLLVGTWDRKLARKRLRGIKPITNGAYMVNTPKGYNKLDGVLECIDLVSPHLPALAWGWTGRTTLERAWQDLKQLPRVGSFVAYEAVTDLRWTPALDRAPDILTWAAAGPGCAKGLGYVLDGNPQQFNYGSPAHQALMLPLMRELLAMSRDPAQWPAEYAPWEMRTCEHWLCEHAKIMNARAGLRLKRRYKPS